MKIFTTGASGFLGGAIAGALKFKHELLAMSRSEKSDGPLSKFAKPVRCEEPHRGDGTPFREALIRSACSNCRPRASGGRLNRSDSLG